MRRFIPTCEELEYGPLYEDGRRIGKHPLEIKLERAFNSLCLDSQERQALPRNRTYQVGKERIKLSRNYWNSDRTWHDFSADRTCYVTYFHMVRVALHFFDVLNFLGANREWKKHALIAGVEHDTGKIIAFNPHNHDKRYPEYKKHLRQHSRISADFVAPYDPIAAAIIERSHIHQPDPYPKELKYPQTPEVDFTSKVLAIVDFYDSASTRQNSRIKSSFSKRVEEWAKTKGRHSLFLPTKADVKKALLEERNFDMTYLGDKLPKITHHSAGFIEMLYAHRVLGHANPLNPYPKRTIFLK